MSRNSLCRTLILVFLSYVPLQLLIQATFFLSLFLFVFDPIEYGRVLGVGLVILINCVTRIHKAWEAGGHSTCNLKKDE